MIKIRSLLSDLIKYVITVIVVFVIFISDLQFSNAISMKNSNHIVEELRLRVPAKYKQAWINAEKKVWEPWLLEQEGFIGRQIFYNKNKDEALLLVNWESRELWKKISSEEVNKMQELFDNNVKNALNINSNPFQLIYEGELLKEE